MTQLGSHLFQKMSKVSSEYLRISCIKVDPAGNTEGQMYITAEWLGCSHYRRGGVGSQAGYLSNDIWITHDRR